MINRTRVIATTLLLLAACTPCTKKVDCPAYSGHFLYAWFPYWEEGTSRYFNSTTGTDTLTIDDVVESTPYQYNEGTVKGWGGDGEFTCDAYGIIQSRENAQHPQWLNLRITHHASFQKWQKQPQLEINLNDYNVVLTLDNDQPTGILNDSMNLYKLQYTTSTIDINGKSYTEAIVLTTENKETALQEKIDKLYIAKEHGLIGYRTYPDHKEYWLQ
ncbi:MAG: hypothetical protein R2800_13070 [Flavipsychrobacter sp.]